MKLAITIKAQKQLLRIDSRYIQRISNGINQLPLGSVTKLVGKNTDYRLRIGGYRILFTMTTTEIVVYKIMKRGDVY